jgi:hypothetical protein
MLFVPRKSVVGLYGAGKCAKHLAPPKKDMDPPTQEIPSSGGMMDDKKIDSAAQSKPHMDKIIQKLNSMKTLKRRKIVFDA